MDALDVLMHDHRMVEQLFRDYEAAASDRQRRGVVELLVRELSKHAALEEMLLYPLARKVLPDGDREIDEHLSEHMGVKQTLLALDRLGEGDQRTGELVAELRREVSEHIQEEEGTLMPRLRDAVSQHELDRLGELIGQAKATAPTRPHPHAPDQPPALTLAAPLAAAYDRLRDRLQRRPTT
ncbi:MULTISPECIES: hemerythrin domain-containing protein [Streptomyces]|uniref:Hemerythrin domain-containing protein n=1 Tax=Streptomyces flaveolus TaxID=67297 RepID=A0ABV3ACN9_9ACTN|nr:MULTISPECIES: hemerythrin domain-containing protein [Streptomyces]KMS89107.1 cation-binding protein [Streptomyces regensis]KOG64851.1 cation-binding protein [Streptomyces antibioticus]MBG7697977.1 hemerythrin domain-containing protein [Streptomyces sp. MC1]